MASRAIRIQQAAAGRAHTLFLSESGNVYACGSNASGQCGRRSDRDDADQSADAEGDDSPDLLVPRPLRGPLEGLPVEEVCAGDDHSSAITAPAARGGATGRSRVFTWGLNDAGQCAQGRATGVVRGPQEAELLSGARTIGCGGGHTLVVL